MARIIGREEEIAVLQSLQDEDESAFVAVYGRRRVENFEQHLRRRLDLKWKEEKS